MTDYVENHLLGQYDATEAMLKLLNKDDYNKKNNKIYQRASKRFNDMITSNGHTDLDVVKMKIRMRKKLEERKQNTILSK